MRLGQVLDTLVNFGIFSYDQTTGRYANNRASALVNHSHWTQWHRWSDLYGTDIFDVSRALPDAVKAGETRSAVQIAHNTDLSMFEYFSTQGRISKFHGTLGAGAIAQAPGLSVDYPWHEVADQTVVDIGAGSGEFLAGVMRAHPRMKGVYFDLPHAVDMVRPHFEPGTGKFADIVDRMVGLLAGNFLERVPPSAVYTMKWCLHDWLDEHVVRILQTIRDCLVVAPGSRLIVLESVKKPGRSSRIPNYGDLVMLITANGKERSEKDWASLAEQGGWQLHRIYPVRRAWLSAIDLRPM